VQNYAFFGCKARKIGDKIMNFNLLQISKNHANFSNSYQRDAIIDLKADYLCPLQAFQHFLQRAFSHPLF
jgi:hypothetical protein